MATGHSDRALEATGLGIVEPYASTHAAHPCTSEVHEDPIGARWDADGLTTRLPHTCDLRQLWLRLGRGLRFPGGGTRAARLAIPVAARNQRESEDQRHAQPGHHVR